MNKKIYLDHAATTPLDKKVLKKMLPYFSGKYGNASSLHLFGEEAAEAVEKSRKIVADFFGSLPEEIIFTSGATESNNLAIKGIVRKYWNDQKRNGAKKPHIITSAFEHHCVLESIQSLEQEDLAEATFIKPQKDGVINPKDIQQAIKPNTILVSVMYVNNEIGTIQPIAQIGKIVSGIRKSKSENQKYPLFHTDATQALNYFDCKVDKFNVDFLSMSAHKIYGPKGIGALYVKKGTPFQRVQDGGGQEKGLRAGTLNVPGIVGLGEALNIIGTDSLLAKKNKKIMSLRDYLIKEISKKISGARLNGSKEKRSPNNVNFTFANIEGESLLLMLSSKKIACSTGSACSSGSLQPSHVLLSLGLKPEETHGSLRITLGKHTTKKELDIFIKALKTIVEQLRTVSGNVLEDYYNKPVKF